MSATSETPAETPSAPETPAETPAAGAAAMSRLPEHRTHTCGALRAGDAGRRAVLQGWVHRRRDHGGLIFIDLRDRYGTTQVVFNPSASAATHELAGALRAEYVVSVAGTVSRRPSGTENPNLPTGDVEVAAESLVLLNAARTPPFYINEDAPVEEGLRLKYRYLDLRRAALRDTIVLRHRVVKHMRDFLDARDFVEIETPILTRSTPEGSRDFLVPSRLHAGEFYALPQAPQQFKQLLMVAGMDRYFQIARCFRDEDQRADRQPEFTQLDLEMSFVDEGDVTGTIEALYLEIAERFSEKRLLFRPFPRLTYAEAMARYGTDRPDLRFGLELEDVSELLGASGFGVEPGDLIALVADQPAVTAEVLHRLRDHLGARLGLADPNVLAFCWVVDFPLLERDEERDAWTFTHNPFCAPKDDDVGLLDSDPGAALSKQYDLICNGFEVGGGSVRIHARALQQRIFGLMGYTNAQIEEQFGTILEALEYGAPPHGGIATGLDRLIAIMASADSIRDAIAFPKNQAAADLMMGAPSPVEAAQLSELHVRLAPPPAQ